MTVESDAVILHLWQAVQVVIDLAVSTCVKSGSARPRATAKPSASSQVPAS